MSATAADQRPRVVIVGAGIAGLSAAWELTRGENPPEVVLLEAGSRAGGVIETLYDPPYLIERAADNFATLIPDALELCKETGYAENLITPRQEGRQAFVVRRGKIYPIPVGFSLVQPTRVWPILSTGTLSPAGKLRLLCEYFVKARRSEEDESLESFALRRVGREAFEQLVEPIVSGIFTADPKTLSMQATLPQFVAMEQKHGGLMRGYLAARREDSAAVARRASGARYDQFMAPREGMSHLLNHLVDVLPKGTLKLHSPVRSIERSAVSDARWTVRTDAEQIACDGIVLASPVHSAVPLLASLVPESQSTLSSIPYASSAVVVMIVDRAELKGRTDGFGLIVPRNERRPVLAISYTSNKYPGRAPDDKLIMRIFLGGAMDPAMMDRSDSQIAAIAEQQLKELLKWSGQGCRRQLVVRWKEAMPQYHVGHNSRVKQLESQIAALGNIRICGAGYHGVGIPQTVRSARRAARELRDGLQMNRSVSDT